MVRTYGEGATMVPMVRVPMVRVAIVRVPMTRVRAQLLATQGGEYVANIHGANARVAEV